MNIKNKTKKKESIIRGSINRVLQILARIMPGATTWRVWINQARGVKIGKNSWIGYDSILETSRPYLIDIGDNVAIGIRCTIIAHFRNLQSVVIEDDAFIGPGVIILPNVKIGKGAVITAGSVVTSSVAPFTVVQGNPAVPIAKCKIPLTQCKSLRDYTKNLTPLKNQI